MVSRLLKYAIVCAMGCGLVACSGGAGTTPPAQNSGSSVNPVQATTVAINGIVTTPVPRKTQMPAGTLSPTPIATSLASTVSPDGMYGVRVTYTLPTNTPSTSASASQAAKRRKEYISTSNTLIKVVVTPVGGSGTNYGPTACTTGSCVISFTANPGPNTLTFTLTDGSNNILSSFSTVQIVQPVAVNTFQLSANPVVNSVSLSVASPSLTAGTAANDVVTVNALDVDGNIITGSQNYTDANGNPLAITLSVNNSQAGGSGSVTLQGITRRTNASQAGPTAYYNGAWLQQATITATTSLPIGGSISSVNVATVPHAFEYASAGNPLGITSGPDGNLWFIEYNGATVGKITTGGTISTYACVGGCNTETYITTGPDGNLWYSESIAGKLDQVTPSGTVTRIAANSPIQVMTGPDGNLWYSSDLSSEVGKSSTKGMLQNFPTATSIRGMCFGPDGNVWYVSKNSTTVSKMDTNGNILANYTVANTGSSSDGIVAGPDGNMWFANYGSNLIEKITMSGVVTAYSTQALANPRNIIVGPDGNLWFTEQGTSSIGKITTGGVITEYGAAYGITAASAPIGITSGPDGNIWFTEYSGNRIGKFVL